MTQKQIENQIKSIIFKYLSPQKYKIFVYGSRAAGKARKWSDWDIGVISNKPIPHDIITEVEEKLENSDLPVIVQVVDFNAVDPEFKQIALQHTVPWTN